MTKGSSTPYVSKRVKKFRSDLVAVIPRIPNNKKSLEALRSKHLTNLLSIYLCWRLRNIAVRPRKVTGLSALERDHRADALRENIEVFAKAVEAGMSLGPYLSHKAHRQAYVMASDPELTDTTTWEDKDFVLNALGLHHFHLGLQRQSSGFMERTNEVLVAFVTRDTFESLGLFDHSAFDWSVDQEMTLERKRLWSIRDEYRTMGEQPGAIYLDGYGGVGITTAGTPTMISVKAMRHAGLIRDIDPKLDDFEYVKTLFAGHTVPKKLNLEWHYNDMDFGLLNRPSRHFIVLMRGPN